MSNTERRGWIIVASLFVTLFLVFGGGFDTAGVFFTPLLKHFGWRRAQLSTLAGAASIAAGASAPFIGWLLDRIEARIVIVAGAVTTALAFFAASRADSFAAMLAAYVVMGVGATASTTMPCSIVIANWFGARRGIALGVALAGTSLGGTGMTIVANYVVARHGWRGGYVAMAVPMLVIVVPLIILTVRSRPPDSAPASAASDAPRIELPGLEIRDAVRCRSFWMISIADFMFAAVGGGAVLHLISYLIGIGYSASFAAGMMSLVFLFTSVGKLAMGLFADRVSARIALALDFTLAGVGIALALGAHNRICLAAFVAVFGLTLGAPLVLVPMVMADSMGLRRLGSVMGLSAIFATIGGALGPVLAGRIFDVSGSYAVALEMFALMSVVAGGGAFMCLPLEVEQSRRALAAAAA
ncbi:MAG TPA: MFS transporter [Candidatus Acidoferrales bacterium]|nr:MFS transporter [Candidatus Acidoferrales bacterium]